MSKRQVWAVIALVTVSAWSAVMAVFGQTAAVAAVVPSVILMVEQVGVALAGGESRRTRTASGAASEVPAAEGGDEERAE
ncbi:hypothetical protein SAMN06272735_9192 [Streptomyces sp. TLI_55]|uniref:hypothetical protein n=1 Tax=Streptomyces sp. TLI_55 TaxID=1938861 RepID=UPI000BD650AA|nr:hypothetical protein [Streptomyces sp. TLI_55]SNX88698.1 hypothetical protein SAMN06272735_9192 [Streptomyces sp. TLI_55]